MVEPVERELAPGIFITDYRQAATQPATQPIPQPKKNTSSNQPINAIDQIKRAHADDPNSTINQLIFDLAQLENQLNHLYRSNVELMEELDQSNDPEFDQAIKENESLIVRLEDEKQALTSLIEEMNIGLLTSRILNDEPQIVTINQSIVQTSNQTNNMIDQQINSQTTNQTNVPADNPSNNQTNNQTPAQPTEEDDGLSL